MLEFNSEHQSINGSLKNHNNKIKIRDIVIGGMIIASIFMFSGCSKNVDCNINEPHAHVYVQDDSFDKYFVSEKENKNFYNRTDEYILVDDETKNLIDFENKNGLFRIAENQDKINEIVSSQKDYVEYRYQYTWLMPIPHTQKIGKVTTTYYTYIPTTSYSWTSNPEFKQLTGSERTVHHVYCAYKIVKDENGKMKLVQSEMVDNLNELSDEYVYIKSDFYKKVNLDNKELEVDYEDGSSEGKQLVEDQQADNEQQAEEESKSR